MTEYCSALQLQADHPPGCDSFKFDVRPEALPARPVN